MLQEKIRKDLKEAMKSGNVKEKNILRVVIGEFNRIDKELSDDLATKEVKKMYMNAKEQGNVAEAEILNRYIPNELSEDELKVVIQKIINFNGITAMKEMGIVMNQLQKNHPNQYNGKIASDIVKELLIK